MTLLRNRFVLAVFSAFAALAAAGSLRALAEAKLLPSKSVEQRLVDLEAKVQALQIKLSSVEASVARAPRLGYQATQQ